MSRSSVRLAWIAIGLAGLSHGGFLAPVSQGADASSEPAVLARVGDEPITMTDLEELLGSMRPPTTAEIPPGLSPDGVIERLVQNRLLEQEGYRSGAHEKKEVKNQVWDLKRHRAMMALLDSISAEARAFQAEGLKRDLEGTVSTMLRVAHILVGEETLARAVYDSVRMGIPFSELVERHSQDTTWAGAEGDLGWARQDLYIPEFAEALKGLSPREVAEPVQTEVGWHVLQLTESRTETLGQTDHMTDALIEAERTERVMKVTRAFVRGLHDKYSAEVDSTLLASLDYRTEDLEAQRKLRSSEEILVTLPWRTLTVQQLSRQILFEHFHGIQDKPNAAELRDQVMEDWLTELLLRHEASVLGFDRKPGILAQADQLERRLVREAVIGLMLKTQYTPDNDEIKAYHAKHPETFTPEPRVKLDGVFLSDEAAAQSFRKRLDEGAQLSWLAKRTEGVVDAKPSVFSDWIPPKSLGLEIEDWSRGTTLGPWELFDTWAVARVTEVESARPLPLEDCRGDIVRALTSEKRKEAFQQSLELLRAETEIEILKDGRTRVERKLEGWMGRRVESAKS